MLTQQTQNNTGRAARFTATSRTAAAKRRFLTELLLQKDADRVLEEHQEEVLHLIPELRPLVGFEQHNPYHCHDIWGHTLAVVEAAPAEPVMRWAALFHDIGKPETFFLDQKGVGHFYGHPAISAQTAESVMRRLGFADDIREQVLFLVRNHDQHLVPTDKSIRRTMARLGGAEPTLQLLNLMRADTMGQSPAFRDRLALYDDIERLVRRYL